MDTTKIVNKLKNIILPPLELTEQEKKVESIVNKLLSKEDTTIKSDIFSNSFIISNKSLDYHVKANGHISIIAESYITTEQFRQTFMDKIKELIAKEESRRFKETEELIFKRSMTQLDEMENVLNK